MLPEHSLHYLLFERTKWTFIDYNNTDYKIWSVYSLLKGVETLHSHKFVHLAIDPNEKSTASSKVYIILQIHHC